MNFMPNRAGFCEDDPRSVRPFSQSSSTSSSSSSLQQQQQQQKGVVVPLSYNQHHQQYHLQQQQSRWGWDETIAFRYSSGEGVSQLDLMRDSSSPAHVNNVDDTADDSEEHLLMRPQGGGGDHSIEGTAASVSMTIEREHMFDKVVTPSDVGKLNRLVIPKQHAEKYFPLDSSTNEKGLLLNFEDRNGKPWRFRYSYWNSSQSYVMTKGWSRFVKEKKLDAGDIVSFQRGVGELGKDRLFIDWRRRPDAPLDHHRHHHLPPPPIPSLSLPHHFSFHPWNHPYYLQQQQQQPRDSSHQAFLQSHLKSYGTNYYSSSSGVMNGNPCPGSVLYLRSAPTSAAASPQQVGVGMVQLQRGSNRNNVGVEEAMVFESVPVVQGKAAAKRLRLFGVNMECPIPESDDQCDNILSSTAVPHSMMPQQASHTHFSSSSSISPLQLRPYSGTPVLQTLPSDLQNKGKSSMSLDFDV
ncbi:hypothetical protein M9H77_25093 [Catharanthus roseus]|uniref:Uncharacterized protein n=1 Tax=Catharanthus roseus TaxID=4058 RepID=A0ACC0A7S2_CATRO|nr:hypothetical protein M9H77_25093 [Catharanthus roseus]